MSQRIINIFSLAVLFIFSSCVGTHYFDRPYIGNTQSFPVEMQGTYVPLKPFWSRIFKKNSSNDTLIINAQSFYTSWMDSSISFASGKNQLSQLSNKRYLAFFQEENDNPYWSAVGLEAASGKLKIKIIGHYPADKDPLRKYLNLFRIIKNSDVVQKGIINNFSLKEIDEIYRSANNSDTILYYEMNPEKFKLFLEKEWDNTPSLEWKKITRK